MPPNLLLVLVAVFGFLFHALSTDGGGTVLARIGITTWAIPKGLIAPMLVLLGLGDAIFQGVQKGLSWQDAATQGLIVSFTALGGVVGSQHLTGRDAEGHSMDVTPPKGLLVLLGAGLLAVSVSACSLFTPANIHKAEVVVADSATCLASKQDEPDEQAFIECGIQEAEKLLATQRLHAMRAETSKHALAAANIAAHDAKLGCAK